MMSSDPTTKSDAKVIGEGYDDRLSHIDGNVRDVESSTGSNTSFPTSSRSLKFFRSVLFQMVLFGALSFVGPSMVDAISNLGGGGLKTPYLANLANSLNYVAGCFVSLIGGPLINKFSIKWSCVIAAVGMPLSPSGYYVNAKYGIAWYLIFAKIFGGFTNGFLYVAETTAMLSYPDKDDRGFYLGVWSAMRNSGSIIGGGINFSTNYTSSKAGGIAWSTYLIFVGFACTGIVWALLLSPTRLVRRNNGSKVPSVENSTWAGEFRALWNHAQRPKTWLVFIPAFYSFFYGGTMGTYLSLHFSVRARALSSLITPSVTVPLVIAFGKLLDLQRWSQKRRAWISFFCWVIPQSACFIWIGFQYSKFGDSGAALDYTLDGKEWAKAYFPYLIIFTSGYLTQLSLYWILGTFSTDVKASSRTGGLFRAFETAGQAVSYAINSQASSDPRVPLYVNCALLALSIPSMIFLIKLVPVAPATTDIDGDDPTIEGLPVQQS